VLDINPQHTATPPQEPVDPEQQRMLGEMARGKGKPTPETGGNSSEQQRPGSRARLTLAAILCSWLLQLYLRKLWRRIAIYLCPVADLPRVGLRAALGYLADAGFLRQWGSTREEFASALRPAVPSLEVLTRLHAQASLGAVSARLSRRQYMELCHNVFRQVHQATPGWRRVLGWLNPTTAWGVH
jgi:hypothetical protein